MPACLHCLHCLHCLQCRHGYLELPDEVHVALRIKAAQAGLSMEAEARRILADTCLENKQPAPAKKLQTLVQTLYGKQKPVNVTEELMHQRRAEAKTE